MDRVPEMELDRDQLISLVMQLRDELKNAREELKAGHDRISELEQQLRKQSPDTRLEEGYSLKAEEQRRKKHSGKRRKQQSERRGCRLVAKAVQSANREGQTENGITLPRFANVIFAAPDVKVANFITRYMTSLTAVTRRLSVYFSTRDGVLVLAERMDGGSPRLGQTGMATDNKTVLELVDYSVIPGGLMNLSTHNRYREYPVMIKDIRGVLTGSIPASHRQLLDLQKSVSLTTR